MGMAKGKMIAFDSTDFPAYCNPDKKVLSDSCATWGHSATKGWVFGYKAHIAVDAEAELPLAVTIFPAHIHDHDGFFPTFKELLKHFTYGITKILGDCAYDATDIYEAIRGRRITPVIAVNGRGHYESISPKDKDYRKRVSIERVNSRSKIELGLENLKMRGLWAATIHVLTVLSSMLFAAVGSFLAGFSDWRSIVSLRY